jgi:hypothetical protein
MLLTQFVFLLRGPPQQEACCVFKIFQHHITTHAVDLATQTKVTIAVQTIKHHVRGTRLRARSPLLTSVTGCCGRGCAVIVPIEMLLVVGVVWSVEHFSFSLSFTACGNAIPELTLLNVSILIFPARFNNKPIEVGTKRRSSVVCGSVFSCST